MDKKVLLRTIFSLTILGGICLSQFTWSKLDIKQGDIEMNPLSLKGSPYGKTIALAMQGDIDYFWHASYVGQDEHHHDHDCEDDCDHDHGHDHDNNLELIGYKEKEHTNHIFVKRQIRSLRKQTVARNSKFLLTNAHKTFVREKILSQIKLSYEMDRKSFDTYSGYHFFLVDYGFAPEDRKLDLAMKLADDTISLCSHEKEDISVMLTAMIGYEHKMILMLENKDAYSLSNYRPIFNMANQTVSNFYDRLEELQENGEINQLSKARLDDILGKFRSVSKRIEIQQTVLERTYSPTYTRS